MAEMVIPLARDFQVFVKPAGATCNMACRYCYYLKAADLYAGSSFPRMPERLLERYIAQHIAACSRHEVTFSWHGGEPTTLGVDYFRTVVALQRRHAGGRRVINGIQTNGLLLDDDWCRFLAEEGFRVGLSMDGPAELHDADRVTRGQAPTHAQVLAAFERLKRHHVACDILCVVHAGNVRHATTVYRFFGRIGAVYLGFLPLVQPSPDSPRGVTGRTVPALEYGEFLCRVFDEWAASDVGRIAVQAFEEASRPARGLDHSLCIFRETCGDLPVVEHNGDFYACDHFVDPAHRFGTIAHDDLAALIEHPAQRAFGQAKRDTLPRCCRECSVLGMCNGGCPKDRFIRTSDGEQGLNYLCAGYKRFFTHVAPWAERVAREEPGRAAFEQLLAAPKAAALSARTAGRNDPCPCGSGRKFKKCCGRKGQGSGIRSRLS